MAWMVWTVPTALFFAAVALLLGAMTVWEIKSPTVPRRGFLPMVTSRGDRLFIGLLTAAFINLAWTGLMYDTSQWIAVVLAVAVMLVVGRWG